MLNYSKLRFLCLSFLITICSSLKGQTLYTFSGLGSSVGGFKTITNNPAQTNTLISDNMEYDVNTDVLFPNINGMGGITVIIKADGVNASVFNVHDMVWRPFNGQRTLSPTTNIIFKNTEGNPIETWNISAAFTANLSFDGEYALTDMFDETGPVNSVAEMEIFVDFEGSSDINNLEFKNITLSDITLPIELESFDLKLIERDHILVSWITRSEQYAEEFVLERSSDAQNWELVKRVNPSGIDNGGQHYQFLDTKPIPGISYYRLQQIDFDGQSDYSDIKSIRIDKEPNGLGELFPNPSSPGIINLERPSDVQESFQASVFDLTGRFVLLAEGLPNNNRLSFDFSSLNKGAYLVKLETGGKLSYQKLIIH